MATAYALFCREDQTFLSNGGKVLLFPSSAAASTHQGATQACREDVVPSRGAAKTWDVVSVTIK